MTKISAIYAPGFPPINTSASSDSEAQDIWFDAIDFVEMDEKWFDASEDFSAGQTPEEKAKEKADEIVLFTEDCRRCAAQLIRLLADIKQNELISAGLSKMFPGIPSDIIMTANSLYTAITERRNIDIAVLHTLGLASAYLLEEGNAISRLAYFIRETILDYTGNSYLGPFLSLDDGHPSEYMFTALAVLAVAARYWMTDNSAPQRRFLKVPAFMGNLLIRASSYWNALGRIQLSQSGRAQLNLPGGSTLSTLPDTGWIISLDPEQETLLMKDSCPSGLSFSGQRGNTTEGISGVTVQGYGTPSGENTLIHISNNRLIDSVAGTPIQINRSAGNLGAPYNTAPFINPLQLTGAGEPDTDSVVSGEHILPPQGTASAAGQEAGSVLQVVSEGQKFSAAESGLLATGEQHIPSLTAQPSASNGMLNELFSTISSLWNALPPLNFWSGGVNAEKLPVRLQSVTPWTITAPDALQTSEPLHNPQSTELSQKKTSYRLEDMQQKEQRRWKKLCQDSTPTLKLESVEQLYHNWLKKPENTKTRTGLLREQYIRTQSENYQHWLLPTRNVIAYLRSHLPRGYLTLTDTRLHTARLFPGMPKNDSLSDEQLFTQANRLLDPLDTHYSITLAMKFTQYEALLYYISSHAITWDFDLTADDIEHQFLTAHIHHNYIFEPKRVIDFYNAQFHVAQRQPAEEFKNRNQLGLEKYYAQFNDYLKNHASDDAAKIVEQTAILMNISQLDLARQFTPLFSLRLGYYQSELLPQTAQRVETFKPGGFIYIVQGDSGKRYATSTWGSLFVVAEVSELFTPDKVIRISTLPDGRIVDQLTAKALLTALWPNGGDFIATKPMIVAKYSYSIPLEAVTFSLRDALIKLQHEVIKNYVDVWRNQHLDKRTTEKILSFVPFFEVIQRKINDPHYSPSLKDLAFDLFDMSLTLLSLGIPLIKLGVSGMKSALIAMKTGRAAGLTGVMLRQAILAAVKPTLKKMAAVSTKEIASFVVPPVDLFRMLRKPAMKGVRKLHNLNKVKTLRRCARAPDKTCISRIESSDALSIGSDYEHWDKLVSQLYNTPSRWQGTGIPHQYRHQYIKAFKELSDEQKEALRGWSWTPWQKPYRSYPEKKTPLQGGSNNNFNLNEALWGSHPLSEEMKLAAKYLNSALEHLPDMLGSQSLIRVVDISEDSILRFHAGDIVTNYPAFMSASSQGKLANLALARGYLFDAKMLNQDGAVLAVYHISAQKAKPLIKGITTQAESESEYLFKPKSFFSIQAISQVTPVQNTIRTRKTIYFIKLEEVRQAEEGIVKNIHSGNRVTHDSITM